MMVKKNKFSFNILSFLISFLLVIVILETYVRIVASDNLHLDIEMLKYAKSHKLISKNKDIGIEHKKNIKKELMNVEIKLNSQGFRNDVDIDHSKKKILMLGDSITLGWGSSKTFSNFLENKLNNNYQVLNSGIGNTNTMMQVNNFFENFSKYNFDMIVLNVYINDFEKVKITKPNFIVKNFFSFTYFAGKIRKILIENSLKDNYESFYLKALIDEKFVTKSLNSVKKLNNYCKKEKIIFIINNVPEIRGMKNYKFHKHDQIVKNFAKQNEIKFINSLDILQKYDENTLFVTSDDSHYNEKAHMIIAKFLMQKLSSELSSL